jgi:hypothetical protein
MDISQAYPIDQFGLYLKKYAVAVHGNLMASFYKPGSQLTYKCFITAVHKWITARTDDGDVHIL